MIVGYLLIPSIFLYVIVETNFKKIIIIYLCNHIILIRFKHRIYVNYYTNTLHLFNEISMASSINKLFSSTTCLIHQLVKFKGKGFKLFKNTNIINFLFNYSHPQYLVPRVVVFRKIKRIKILLCTSNLYTLNNLAKKFCSLRVINIYTKNGFRLKRQLVYKRKGKTIAAK